MTDWRQKDFDLPISDDKSLLLVPRDWARPRLLMSAARYYETTMLSFAHVQRTVIDATTGKELRTPKDQLKKTRKLARGYDTVVRVPGEAQEIGEALMNRFRHFVDTRHERLADDTLDHRTA